MLNFLSFLCFGHGGYIPQLVIVSRTVEIPVGEIDDVECFKPILIYSLVLTTGVNSFL
jgi:hypothetical protein